jgi:hypothetical protein
MWNHAFKFEMNAYELDFLVIFGYVSKTVVGHFVAPIRAVSDGFIAVPLETQTGRCLDSAFLLSQFGIWA